MKKCKNSEECETADARQRQPNTTQGLYIHQEYIHEGNQSHVQWRERKRERRRERRGESGKNDAVLPGLRRLCGCVCVLSLRVHSAAGEEWGQLWGDGQLGEQLVQHAVQQHIGQL